MKKWEKPQINNLLLSKTKQGCPIYAASEAQLAVVYPEGVEAGTAGPWCCDCVRPDHPNPQYRCGGRSEYLDQGNTCHIS